MTDNNEYNVTTKTIFTYIPNLIGYSRVVTAIVSLFLMKQHPIYMTFIYGVSCLLDAFDGTAARRYNQTSKFGAVLDMVTDRCTTASLIAFLVILYPSYAILWQCLISLDLASHYMHMYASLVAGSGSHKNIDEGENFLLKLYYTSKKVLFTVCAFNELFYVALYLAAFDFNPLPLVNMTFGRLLAVVSFPIWLFKQFTNVIQLVGAATKLAEIDVTDKVNELRKKDGK
ncbi:Phosphatidylinositol synthase [Komagataella phaffii CBS 7435]|uniref:CDP-diacylglycerol--inositol 3-phosphatidyltransferase n=2 Tax=Komagataella phaffii TaxID=460519 RepID=C4R1G9_KOMPG|nr:Phosphatidylinositol synthase, required for biosynthesis of phosphatidylinositol [Komagataella phaffii GS115]AOA62372.1 GQ67_00761T0 [Komagataella phaffii]CAH2448127.1 Phosphatidylinositol synthase [Komagataella phaffii CBS 7435]AOA67873.1 GQ68_00628T0 [Komagataella phaffii GS115]CAY69343.1 Phosphatidylinositol synthase, required for biosynthesis of phosphatidylinositol [Komagataella phaffii GS115]CCA38272.1 Phosphatidylinositol synthase [Komagataella phaffii CBS 7435]